MPASVEGRTHFRDRQKVPVTHSVPISSDPCDQQHNCQAGGEARCSRTFDSA